MLVLAIGAAPVAAEELKVADAIEGAAIALDGHTLFVVHDKGDPVKVPAGSHERMRADVPVPVVANAVDQL